MEPEKLLPWGKVLHLRAIAHLGNAQDGYSTTGLPKSFQSSCYSASPHPRVPFHTPDGRQQKSLAKNLLIHLVSPFVLILVCPKFGLLRLAFLKVKAILLLDSPRKPLGGQLGGDTVAASAWCSLHPFPLLSPH